MAQVERFYGTGRRKMAVARVWVSPGEGEILVNGRSYEEYFPRESSRLVLLQAFAVTETTGKFDVHATAAGGGPSAQAEAMRHGISRALCEVDPDFRPPLKKAGFLTRDARIKERKKYGQPGARKRYQYSKR